MKDKAFKKSVLKMGGVISDGGSVKFPVPLQIITKKDALCALDIMRYANDLEDTDFEYAVDLDEPLDALIAAIKRGML